MAVYSVLLDIITVHSQLLTWISTSCLCCLWNSWETVWCWCCWLWCRIAK